MKKYPIGVLIDGKTHEKKDGASKYAGIGDQSRCVAEMKKPAPIEITIRRREEQSHGHDDHRHAFFVILEPKRENESSVDVMKFPKAQAKK